MNILVHLQFPLRSSVLGSGTEAAVSITMEHLTRLGFRFLVLCPPSNDGTLASGHQIQILPYLNEVDVCRPDMGAQAQNNEILQNHLHHCDAVLTVDRVFPIKTQKPVIFWCMTLGIYSNEFVAIFDARWDYVITPSNFALRELNKCLPNRALLSSQAPATVVPLPLDPIFSRASNSKWLPKWLGHTRRDYRYLLFPHRMERAKGHGDALSILEALIQHDRRFHLLVPQSFRYSFEKSGGSYEAEFIETVRQRMLTDYVSIHPWVDRESRPNYFRGGECCLHLSSLPETFGMVLVESVASRTPVASRGTGALPEILPDGRGHIVLGDVPSDVAAEQILSRLQDIDVLESETYILDTFSAIKCAERMADAIRAAVHFVGNRKSKTDG